jgi:VWFA-related protein
MTSREVWSTLRTYLRPLAVALALLPSPDGGTAARAAQREQPAPSVDLVVIDVAVTDSKGAPITDLKASDFRVKEDGREVDVKTFARVPDEEGGLIEGRSIALLLDDAGVPALGTLGVQQLSKAVLSLARQGDEVSVVRLHSRTDEAFGDMTEALTRIDRYRGGVLPFVPGEAQVDALNRIASMSEQMAISEGRRKAIVCIGAQGVCDGREPANDTRQEVIVAWRRAVTAAALANVAVYAIIPGRIRMRGGGIADATGGLTYASFSDFREPIVALWNDSGFHYLIGYWPSSKSRDLHSISVSVVRPKVHVRARRLRGG